MENLYECMFVLDSGPFAADPDRVANEIVDLINRAGGEVVSHRPWQEGRLAYSIAGHRKGVHYLALFKMPPERIKELARLCKLNSTVLRHMVIRHPQVLFDAMVAALEGHAPVADESAGDESQSQSDSDNGDESADEGSAETHESQQREKQSV